MPSSRPGWSPQGPLLRIGSALAAWRTPKTRRLFRKLTVTNAGADAITLTAQESATLSACANGSRVAHRDVVRARIVLAAAQGVSNARIASALGLHVDTVRKWRRRFAARRLAGLHDRPRSGRPRVFTPAQVAEVKAVACELPTEPSGRGSPRPLARWSAAELAGPATCPVPRGERRARCRTGTPTRLRTGRS